LFHFHLYRQTNSDSRLFHFHLYRQTNSDSRFCSICSLFCAIFLLILQVPHRGDQSQGAFHVDHSAVPSNQSVPSGNIRLHPLCPHFVEQPARVGQRPVIAEDVDQAIVDPNVRLHLDLCISTMRMIALFHMPLSSAYLRRQASPR
jgi:hypothetical protein